MQLLIGLKLGYRVKLGVYDYEEIKAYIRNLHSFISNICIDIKFIK